jgi:hypothetical protein
MPAPAQKGTALFAQRPPVFDGYHVVGGTWKESDATKSEATPNENEETFNVSYWDSGRDASCTLVSESSQPRIKVGDQLTEGAGSPTPGQIWIVTKASYTNFGSRALKAEIDLMFRDALQPS